MERVQSVHGFSTLLSKLDGHQTNSNSVPTLDNALILIVEDEPQIADILVAYFAREGFRTVTAGDGDGGTPTVGRGRIFLWSNGMSALYGDDGVH